MELNSTKFRERRRVVPTTSRFKNDLNLLFPLDCVVFLAELLDIFKVLFNTLCSQMLQYNGSVVFFWKCWNDTSSLALTSRQKQLATNCRTFSREITRCFPPGAERNHRERREWADSGLRVSSNFCFFAPKWRIIENVFHYRLLQFYCILTSMKS